MHPTHKTNVYFIWIALSIYLYTYMCIYYMYVLNSPCVTYRIFLPQERHVLKSRISYTNW